MHIVKFSGGVGSAIAAVEVVRRFGKENVILINSDLSSFVETEDIKRFKQDVADYLGCKYVCLNKGTTIDQFDVALNHNSFFEFNTKNSAFCNYDLKIKFFDEWLNNQQFDDFIVYLGFSPDEEKRRINNIKYSPYKCDFPLFWSNRTITDISEIGILPPKHYDLFKHANCVGCLKAGLLHWFVVYVYYPEVFKKAIETETKLKQYLFGRPLKDYISEFDLYLKYGIVPNEHINPNEFWNDCRQVFFRYGSELFDY